MFNVEIEFGEDTLEALAGRLREVAKLIEENNLEEGEGWALFQDTQICRPAPRLYDVQISVTQLVADDELDPEDLEAGPGREYTYTVEAYSLEGAQEAALDEFHDEVAIHTLDHFDIVPSVQECAGVGK